MNKPLTITDALTGKSQPVKQLPWLYTCTCCGRDNGMAGGYPLAVACVECGERIEADENPDYWTTRRAEEARLTSVGKPTGDHKAEFVSKMLLTKIEAE